MVMKCSNNDNAIVFGVTKDLIFAVANVLIGMRDKKSKIFNTVIIIVEDVNELNRFERDALGSIVSSLGMNLVFIEIKDLIPESIELNIFSGAKDFISKYSRMPLAKLFLPIFFGQNKFNLVFNHVLWLDCDICIVDNFDSITNFAKGYGVCACEGRLVRDALQNLSDYPYLTGKEVKPNGGVILYNAEQFQKISIEEYLSEILKILEKLTKDKNILIEELAITLACAKLNIKMYVLPQIYNYLAVRCYKTNPLICHSVGKAKFWNDPLLNLMFPQWERSNIAWLNELQRGGGTPLAYSKVQSFYKYP